MKYQFNRMAYFNKMTVRNLTIIIFFFCISLLSSAQPKLEVRINEIFNDNWRFSLSDSAAYSDTGIDDSGWRLLNLPHDWSIEAQTKQTNRTAGAGGYFPAGIGWYRKTFDVPSSWQGKCVSIYFGGVYMNSEVFINGESLGVQPYGYTSFYYNLTPHLNYGKENTIAVRVDNSEQINCRWYSGSGIYRSVWLNVTNPIHIVKWGTCITTPEISANKATVQVKTTIKNETDSLQQITLSTQLTYKNAQKAGNKKLRIEIPPNNEKDVVQSIMIGQPMLWAPKTPNLYNAKIEIINDNQTIDQTNHTFGIRKLTFSAEKGFQLNNKPIKINGGCIHHDNGCLGAKAYDSAEIRRVKLLKSAGFNTVRVSHNPPSTAFLNACDSLGLLVVDEVFDGWRKSKTPHDYSKYFDKWWQHDLESMLLRDRNHPSVIMWSIGNEIVEQESPEAVQTAGKLAAVVRKLDPTRPVTSAMTTWDNDWEIFDPLMAEHDVCGYNYQMHRAESDHKRVPSRIILQTESYPRDAFYNWNMVQKHPYIIGEVVWTAMDYLGESGIGRYYYPGDPKGEHWENDFYPWHGAYCGDIDLTGWRKPISHYRNLLWNGNEKLYMAVREPSPDNGEIKETMWAVWPTWESWTWPGHESKNIQVEVYSRYPKVRLYLNSKLIGEQPTAIDQQFKATFTLPYSPGVLKAVGVENDKEIESTILKTVGKSAKIKLTPDRTKLMANGQDLSFVTVEIIDKDGNTQPNAENKLFFRIEGEGVIEGVDNGNLKDTTSYVSQIRNAWHGRAIVIVRSLKQPGSIHLKVSSDGLTDAVIKLESLQNDL